MVRAEVIPLLESSFQVNLTKIGRCKREFIPIGKKFLIREFVSLRKCVYTVFRAQCTMENAKLAKIKRRNRLIFRKR